MNIYQRINAVKEAVREVSKRQTHKHHRYQFAGHDDVTASIRNECVKHGIDQGASVVETENTPDGRARVTVEVIWTNIDEPSEQKRVFSVGEGPPPDKGGKGAPQHIGSAYSYAVKFAILKNFQLVGDDTPDVEHYSDQGSYEPAPAARTLGSSDVERLRKMITSAENEDALERAAGAISKHRHEIDDKTLEDFTDLYNAKVEYLQQENGQ